MGRFEREAKAASRLNHPNGIQVLDFGRNDLDGSLYIVMELVQGKDLRIVLRDEWPLPEERPSVAQGSIAGVPSKLWLRTTGGALLVTQAAYADELAGRLR